MAIEMEDVKEYIKELAQEMAAQALDLPEGSNPLSTKETTRIAERAYGDLIDSLLQDGIPNSIKEREKG